MTRHDMPFQFDRPVFVAKNFRGRSIDWKKQQEFKWKEIGIDEDTVMLLYLQGFIRHDGELEGTLQVGDGLEVLDIPGLHSLVDDYNKRIKAVTRHNTEFEQRKMKKSTIADKQRGLIRSWRRNFETWLTKAEAVKKG